MGFNQPSYHDMKVRAIQKCPKTNMSEAGAVVRRHNAEIPIFHIISQFFW